MKEHWILFSPAFHPLLGGIETVVRVLANEWSRAGIEVTVITKTPSDEPDQFPFHVIRRPSLREQIQLYRGADAVVLANISLWGLLPLIFCGRRRPVWIATHHGWYQNFGEKIKLLDRLKIFLARYAGANISVSAAVDRFLKLRGEIVPNPYDDVSFRVLPGSSRNQDLVYLGRLVSDKGVDLILDALEILRKEGTTPSLTIIGSGPEREFLEERVIASHLSSQVRFVGPQTGDSLVQLLNKHRILVVPSRWDEPFGIVALEGIACGCLVIGSQGGGLPEAIGPCGLTFENGNVIALAACLRQTLGKSLESWADPDAVREHLTRHRANEVARRYREIICTRFQPVWHSQRKSPTPW